LIHLIQNNPDDLLFIDQIDCTLNDLSMRPVGHDDEDNCVGHPGK
jgi:hypothetical protein